MLLIDVGKLFHLTNNLCSGTFEASDGLEHLSEPECAVRCSQGLIERAEDVLGFHGWCERWYKPHTSCDECPYRLHRRQSMNNIATKNGQTNHVLANEGMKDGTEKRRGHVL